MPQPPDAAGWVYFIVCEETRRIKIGWALNPLARFKHLRLLSPTKLSLITAMRGTPRNERDFHERFAEHKRHGEWFIAADGIKAIIHWMLEEYGEAPWVTGEVRHQRCHMPRDYNDTSDPEFRRELRAAFVREATAGNFDLERKVRLRYRKELKASAAPA